MIVFTVIKKCALFCPADSLTIIQDRYGKIMISLQRVCVTSQIIYGSDGVMVALGTVDPQARVRFPVTALYLFRFLGKLPVRVLRTVSQAAMLLETILCGRTSCIWNSICAEGTQISAKQNKIDKNIYKQKLMEVLIWS